MNNNILKVTKVIDKLGIPAHIKGYRFLRDAVLMAIEDMSALDYVTKEIYPTVAQKNNTTSSRVQRAIRHAIEVSLDRGDDEFKITLFGENYRRKLTNSEVIATIADKIIIEAL